MENDNINNLKSEIIKLTKKYGEIKEQKENIRKSDEGMAL